MINKKVFKVLGVPMLAVTLMTSFPVSSYAANLVESETGYEYNSDSEQQEIWVKSLDNETGQEFLLNESTNEKVYDVYATIDGESVKLSIDEALKQFNLNENVNVRSSRLFSLSSVTKVTGAARKLTHDVAGGPKGASISIGTAITTTVTENFTLGGSTEGIKSEVRAGAGVTWSKSLTRSLTTTHNVPANRIGYVAFKPYYNQISGTYNGLMLGIPITEKVTAISPIKIGKICDGLEYLVLK